MAHSYHEIAFTPAVREVQAEAGSRADFAATAENGRRGARLTAREAEFIARRDSFYIASVSETGWPYLQHRGGPKGFMKVLDETTLGFADYAGNRQYISTGNVRKDDRVSLFFMDYPNRRRLKLFGRVRLVGPGEAERLAQLEDRDYPAPIERAFLITVEGFDWNCPAHITPRFTEEELGSAIGELQAERARLEALRAGGTGAGPVAGRQEASLGDGPLPLRITGVRQLTPRVRAYELRDPGGAELPPAGAGAHLVVPVRLATGELSERRYSITSHPARREAYEIAVQREDAGRGGSRAVHACFGIGMTLRLAPPENHFGLHADARPAVLIAGGIGITPLKPMAQALAARGADFHLHYAGRSRGEMPFRQHLERQLGARISVYSSADGERIDLAAVLREAAPDAWVYVCGPDRLLAGVMAAAERVDFDRSRIRVERFS